MNTNLDTTVRKLREQLQKIQGRSAPISEEDTKRVLITPLLQALRWDVLDIDEVRNEFRSHLFRNQHPDTGQARRLHRLGDLDRQ